MQIANALQCYQCDSRDDEFCPAFGRFDETKNALVDCYGLESATPGHMCTKISKNSPDTLYARGWKTVIRRCASRSDFGVTWGCRYYIDEVGLYVETCYCSDRDGCNTSSRIQSLNKFLVVVLFASSIFRQTGLF